MGQSAVAQKSDRTLGAKLLRRAQAGHNRLLWAVALFSVFSNLLQLTGAVYMLQVYDRVLSSRSEPTLVAISGLAASLFVVLAILDHARARITARIGARVQNRLDRQVFAVALRSLLLWPNDTTARAAQSDLEALQRLWASPVLLAIFDIPWIPLFLLLIFAVHPLLGLLALLGGASLIVLTYLTQRLAKQPLAEANAQASAAERMSEQIKGDLETVQALGMQEASFERWQNLRQAALLAAVAAGDRIGLFGTLSRSFRLFLQSAMLGLGAWLVLKDQLTAGAMLASAILLGRALAPIEQAISQWASVARAQEGWERLSLLLSRLPAQPARTALPRPKAQLEVHNLTVFPPAAAQASLRGIHFDLQPGQALGVIGASGAGKSSLARAIIAAWRPAGGHICLGGARLDHYDPAVLGSYIGYLPQRVGLFDGTIAENIARLQTGADAARIVAAAEKAAAHAMILQLPQGYETRVSQNGSGLSGGEIQRIGLARAIFGDPVLLVLDEPNSNLDNEGTEALNHAIRATKAAGGAVIIMAHRPAAIQECEQLLMLENGTCRGFGPRDALLRQFVRNQTQIVAAADLGGVA